MVDRGWKLTQYLHGRVRQAEMYNLERDPNELRRLARRRHCDAEQDRLLHRLEALKDCRGRDCR